MKKISLVLVALVVLATACSKYDEGGLSLRSRAARLANTWNVANTQINGVTLPSINNEVIVFEKDGTGKRYETDEPANELGSLQIPIEFVWEFVDDDTKIKITEYEYDNNNGTYVKGDLDDESDVLQIIKLTEKEVKVALDDDDDSNDDAEDADDNGIDDDEAVITLEEDED